MRPLISDNAGVRRADFPCMPPLTEDLTHSVTLPELTGATAKPNDPIRRILSRHRALLESLEKTLAATDVDEAATGALATDLQALGIQAVECAASLQSRGARLLVATRDARTLVLGKVRVDLSRRPALRLIVCALIAAHGRAPLGMDDLFAAGWPQSRAAPASSAARVYVAINALRTMGLRDVIQSRDDGYALDEHLTIVRLPRI
jgi:hypothetical protein